MSINFSFDEKNISVVLDETNLQINNLEQNVQVNLENQFKIEDLSDKTLVKILMLKGEKGDTGATTGASWGYITGNITDQTDLKNALNSKVNANDLSTVATSGSYNDLTNKPTIPSKTSDLTNDSGFIDAETDPVFTNSVAHEITSTDITNWNNKSTFSGNYNDLTNKPTIPDELSDLSDDSTHRLVTDTEKSTWNAKSDFSGSYNDLSNKPNIPTKTSDLTNDSGFVNSNYHDSTKQDTLVSGQNIKTINNQSILGEGNITVSVSPSVTNNQILWGPDYYYMTAGNTINLSQKVSEQKTGIVLVWQAYSDNAPQPWDYNFTFIPKWQVITNSSRGVVCFLATSQAGNIGTKYVYLFDDKIKGHNDNSTGAKKGNSGITTTNNHWVLTYVLGV